MATEALIRTSCDRCGTVITETTEAPRVAEGAANSFFLRLEGNALPDGQADVPAFTDVCAKCYGRVRDLVRQLLLVRQDKEEKVEEAPKEDSKSRPTRKLNAVSSTEADLPDVEL